MKNQARVRFLLPVLTLVCCLFAGTASAQSVPVTLRVSDAPLEQVLSAIEKQTTYLFVYDKNVDVACRVSIDVKDTPIRFSNLPISLMPSRIRRSYSRRKPRPHSPASLSP